MSDDLSNDLKIDDSASAPPYSNRGAQNTYDDGLRALVDWVSVTFRNVEKPQKIIDFLGIKRDKFKKVEHGKFGYKSQLRFGHIGIYFDGKEDMGVFLDISGQGCREYEAMDLLNWSQLFTLFIAEKGSFTRLDVAIDDFHQLLNMKTMKRKINELACRSRFKSATQIKRVNLSDGTSLGDTIYFGQPSSRIQVRFYDKFLERKAKGHEIQEGVTHWVRCEVQLRKEHANAVAVIISVDDISLGNCVKGILNNYITFTVKSSDTNRARWKVARFWDMFLKGTSKLALTQVAPDLSIERTENWLARQVAPSLAMLNLAYELDMTQFFTMLHDGTNRLDDKHFDILNRHLIKNNQQPLSITEWHDRLNYTTYDLFNKSNKIKKD